MKKYNYIVSAIMLAISGYIFFEVSGYETGTSAQKSPDMWPGFLAGCLAFLAVLLIVETFFSPKENQETEKKIIDWTGAGMKHVYAMLGLTVLFVVLMKIIGMLAALFVIIPIIEWLMGCRNKVMLVALPVGLVAFCYVFFVILMKLTLPGPFWA